MALEFGKMRHGEIRQAAELATRAFDDYEYFTNWFPAKVERNAVQFAIIWREYKTNYGPAKYLVARQDGKLVAVAQLNPPSYRKPSDFRYLIHGWLRVYKAGDRKTIDDWLKMDAAAFIEYWEKYIREHGGKQLVFFTNSRKNLNFYLKRGYEVFDEREFEYDGKKMGSWSLRKSL